MATRSAEYDTVAPGQSLWRLPAMRLAAIYTLLGFTGFFATMSALPAWVAQRGAAESLAGLVTTTLLAATISTQFVVPRLVDHLGMTTTLSIGCLALGAPSLLLLLDDGYVLVLAICLVRGIGFGVITVLGSLLVARIAPAARHGEAMGIYGLAIAIPNLLALAGGVALVTAGLFPLVAILGAAPLLGLLTVRGLGRVARPHTGAEAAPAETPVADPGPPPQHTLPEHTLPSRPPPRAGSRRPRLSPAWAAALSPSLVLLVVTLASSAFLTYVPIERPDGPLATVALVVWGLFGAYSRWQAGSIGDRRGLGALVPGASALSVIGMGLVAIGLVLDGGASWGVILIGAAILGIGFGATQNLTLVAAFKRAREDDDATVSSIWNVAFDGGTALGSGILGLAIVAVTVPGALAVAAGLVALSLPLATVSTRPVSH